MPDPSPLFQPESIVAGQDDAVVRALTARSETALEAIYREHAPAVMRLARRVTGEDRFAEEVTQEVFTTLWRQPDRFDASRGTLRNWLLTLTHRRSVDLVRQENRLVATAPIPLTSELVSPATPVDEEVSDRIAAEAARLALRGLPLKLRDVIVLAYFDGRTQVEIAEILALPLGTVKTRTRTALRHLAASLLSTPGDRMATALVAS